MAEDTQVQVVIRASLTPQTVEAGGQVLLMVTAAECIPVPLAIPAGEWTAGEV